MPMRVSEIMTNAAVIDQSDDTVAEAARKMWKQQTGSLLVMDGDDLVGIITERDVLKATATGTRMDTSIAEVMSKDLVTVGPGTSLREAAKLMAERWIRHLPVVDGGKVVGIISQRDLVGVLAGALNEPEALAQLIEASELVRERRLRRVEHGVWD
jgi:CBS domain-containing protein